MVQLITSKWYIYGLKYLENVAPYKCSPKMFFLCVNECQGTKVAKLA